MAIEHEDLRELVNLLDHVLQTTNGLQDGTARADKLKESRQALLSFHTTVAMLGLDNLERVGIALQNYLTQELEPAASIDVKTLAPFSFAISSLTEEMQNALNANQEPVIHAEEITMILEAKLAPSGEDGAVVGELSPDEFPLEFAPHAESAEIATQENVPELIPGDVPALDFTRMERIVAKLGGRLALVSDNGAGGSFQLSFPVSLANLEKIETLLSPCDPHSDFAPELRKQDSRLERVLASIKEFMVALSTGDLDNAQEILLKLAEQQQQAGLYKQIGSLARELHDSLRGFIDNIDPTLVEMVEDKLPDSGTRLEHILKLTENAANTTLDHVEKMQNRNQSEQDKLVQLKECVEGLQAIGDKAQQRLRTMGTMVAEIQASVNQTSADLITVLTAQDYQDLTGQIILKIIQLLKDLELRLVNVIRTFGVKADNQQGSESKELYGPAHQGKVEALHSQDDVDSLLADFGF